MRSWVRTTLIVMGNLSAKHLRRFNWSLQLANPCCKCSRLSDAPTRRLSFALYMITMHSLVLLLYVHLTDYLLRKYSTSTFYWTTTNSLVRFTVRTLVFTVHYYVNTVQVLFYDYYKCISTFYCTYISFYHSINYYCTCFIW